MKTSRTANAGYSSEYHITSTGFYQQARDLSARVSRAVPAAPGAVITSSVTSHSRISGVEAGVPLSLYAQHSPYSDTLPRPYGYPGKMVYILTLTASEEAASHVKFLTERRLTKAFPKRVAQGWKASAPWIALILTYGDGEDVRYLKWMGTVSRIDTPGQLDYSVTIDPLVRCPQEIPIDGPGGLLVRLPVSLQEEFTTAVAYNDVGNCGQPFWESFSQAVIDSHPKMAALIDWLLAAGTPPDLTPVTPRTVPGKSSRTAHTVFPELPGFRLSRLPPGEGLRHDMHHIWRVWSRARTSSP